MTLELDGFSVLAGIGANRPLFSALAAEIDKTARSLVLKYVKGKTLTLTDLRALREAMGPETVALVFDILTDSEIAALLVKLDKNNVAATKAESESWRRSRLAALVAAEAEPAPAVAAKKMLAKAVKPAGEKPKRPKPDAGLNYVSAGYVRKKSW